MSLYVSQQGVQPFHVHTFQQQRRARGWGPVQEDREAVLYEDFFKNISGGRPGR